MSKYSRERYLRTREKVPKKNLICALSGCDNVLPRFADRKYRKYCSTEHFLLAKKEYKKQWEKEHPENVKAWKKKYSENNKDKRKKHASKIYKIKKLQTIRGTGAFPE